MTRATRAFSMLEMMVVVSILGVMAAMAVPDLSPAVHDAKLRGMGDEVVNFIERARREAKAQGRCFLIQKNAGALEMRRRSTIDCVNVVDASTGWDPPFATLMPPANFSVDLVPVPDTAPFIVRPNGRVRGNNDLEINDDGALLRVRYAPIPYRWDMLITSVGRICAYRTKVPAAAPVVPLRCFGAVYGAGGVSAMGSFVAGGNLYPDDALSAPTRTGTAACGAGAPAPACGGAPAPSCGGAPAPSCGGAPAPSCGGAPAPSCGGAPAPSCGGAPAPSCGGAPAPSCGGAPAPSCGGAPAPSCGGAPAPSCGGAPAPSCGGAPAPSCGGAPAPSCGGAPPVIPSCGGACGGM